MTAGKNFDISIQLVHPLCEMANIIKCEISEMVNNVVFLDDLIPPFDHDTIHLVHALELVVDLQPLADVLGERLLKGGGLVHHSDRGSQYVAIKYTERLTEAGVEPSVGSVGDSYDNALAETINGLYKTEVIRRRGPWRSLEAVEFATLEWVDWFNHRRLLEPIGNIPPAEAEARYYAQTEDVAWAA